MRRIVALGFGLLVLEGCLGAGPDPERPGPLPEARVAPAVGAQTDGLPHHQMLPEKISGLDLVAFGDASGGVRIRLWNNTAYVNTGVAQSSTVIFDVSDPFSPERLGVVESDVGAREGLDVLAYEDRTLIVASLASPVAGPIVFWDVTDPSEPREVARVPVQSHTVAAHRPGRVVYNAAFATGPAAGVEIINAQDPDAIRLEKVWSWGATARDGTPLQPTGCHDIILDSAAERAYCAAQVQTLVWDVSDPLNPVVLTAVHDPFVPHHNTAFPILDGRVLVIGDEEGACGPSAPGAGPLPAGAVWFYDLRTSPPALLGYASPSFPQAQSGCAAHFGSEVGEGTGVVAFGWFGAGLVMIDASDPANPRILEQNDEGGSASDAVYYRGLVFGAGQKGGLQVALPR